MYRVWQNGDNQQSVEAITTNPESSFHAKFLAAEILRRFDIEIPSKHDITLSKTYTYALSNSSIEKETFIGTNGNDWGFLYEFDDVGILGNVLIDLGEVAINDLKLLLEDKSPILYEGSKEATIGNAYQYRVKDFAAFYISEIQNIPIQFHQDFEKRDAEIERLKLLIKTE